MIIENPMDYHYNAVIFTRHQLAMAKHYAALGIGIDMLCTMH